ncbi:MAG: recombination mediator RecR [Firmicutes bacterium]|nr:recombination mediator RecR [Dethiobacter sp.]MBS3888318.1 recombination mediator RecR [Bacillota bacterium]MBS4055430.1 recombination mediator RecR [Thermaerobacter sp.]
MTYPQPILKLISELARLPGIGPKTAQRLAFYLLSRDKLQVMELAKAITEAKDKVTYCPTCFNLAEGGKCALCTQSGRRTELLCVVQDPRDVAAIERTHDYRGQYHVLHGAISPMDGIGPEQLKIRELMSRLQDGDVKEIILATNPNIEGEATALYLARLIKPFAIKVTRLAHGLPVGGDLEYADEMTLARALENRREV